jgi:lysophospholipase L1-like esterase
MMIKFKYVVIAIIFVTFIFPKMLLAEETDDDIRWISFPDPSFEVNGLAWYHENAPDLFRLPKRIKDIVRAPVWNLAQSSSGAAIRFKSNCTTLAIRYENLYTSGMRNMHVFGQSGVDLYTDNVYIGTAIHGKDKGVEHVYFKNAVTEFREHVLYLPLYNGIKIKAIGINSNATITKPSPFAIPKPVVFYGTSITQGGCASRPGMSYQAILCRKLNLEHINLGFSGNGKGEKEVVEAVAEIDTSCFVLDFMANNKNRDTLEKVYEPFVHTIRQKHPTTPIILVTRIYAARESSLVGGHEFIEAKRDVIRNTYKKLISEGDQNLSLVEGYSLLGPNEGDGLVDGSHPNDLGFQLMADRLAPIIAKTLKLPER